MNFRHLRFFLIRLCIAASAMTSCHKVADGDHIIDIYVTTDIHGAYFSRYYLDDSFKPNSLSKVSTIIREARKDNPDLVLIDNGDNLQGDNSAFYFNYVDTLTPHIFARMANYLRYDATVIGNHDIEAGHSVYDRIRAQYRMPLLGANAIHTEGTDVGSPYFDEYAIVTKNGLKVAIIGTTNPKVTNWVTDSLYSGMEFLANGEMLQQLVDRVRKEHRPDFVIVATHSGSGDETVDGFENDALYMASNLSGVDMVIGGHDHHPLMTSYKNKETTTGYINPGPRCHYLGHARFVVGYKGGKRVKDSVAVELIPLENVQPDSGFDAEFEADYQAVKTFTTKKICNVSKAFSLAEALDGPSVYMKLLADVELAACGADIALVAPLTSSGTIREGELVYNDLSRIYPFENKLYTIAMTGEQIKSYLEYSYQRWINHEGPAYCYDSAIGLRYKVYKRRPFGSRVEIESMQDGSPFELKARYTAAVTSYRAMGGDGMLEQGAGMDISNPDAYIVNRYDDIRELLYDYLTAVGTFEAKANDNWIFVE